MTPILSSERTAPPPGAEGTTYSRWFFGFGPALLLLGVLAFGHLAAAAVISTFVIGAIMLAGGLLQLGQTRAMRSSGFGTEWRLGSLFYVLAGLAILFEPVAGANILTLGLAFLLVISGVSRLIIGTRPRGSWMLLSGAVSIMAGMVIAMEWPSNSLWVLGFVIAFDLVTLGAATVGTGYVLRRARF